MKNFFLTATMLVGFLTIAQAQQGRIGINTTTPAATFDVAGSPSDPSKLDALIVPRMTATQLEAKDDYNKDGNSRNYGEAQKGAIVYITSGSGTDSNTRTNKITGPGFYFFDGSKWVAVAGAPAPTVAPPVFFNVRDQTGSTISDADVGGAILVKEDKFVEFDLSVLDKTKAKGKTIAFINVSNTKKFAVVGGYLSPVSPESLGTALIFVCDGNAWYNYSSY